MSTSEPALRIRWAPKLRPEKLVALYRADALGVPDSAMLGQVGDILLRRCESIVLVSSWRFVCPRCGDVVTTNHQVSARPEDVITCAACEWRTTRQAFHGSWQHLDLFAGNDQGAFEHYVDNYPLATTDSTRMLLIDQLIHEFHQFLTSARPHRLVAVNLIEGNHKQVLALLDGLAYGDASSDGVTDTRREWHRRRDQMGRG